MNSLKTTNTLLLLLVLPVVFYILHLLSFIFIPLMFSMFIALLFLPVMRWLIQKKVPKYISLFLVISIIVGFISILILIMQLSIKEILASSNDVLPKTTEKLTHLLIKIESFLGIEKTNDLNIITTYLKKLDLTNNLKNSFSAIGAMMSSLFLTAFFSILLLAGSINFQKILNNTIIKQKFSSIKIFMQIEKNLLTFIKAKFIISFFTGLGFTLACYYFDVSFPIFWGFFAFSINFVQMIGSIISIILLSIFAFLEIDSTTTLLFFILSISLVQIIMGSVLEPIFMGKSFSINVIAIVIMLLFWGYIWGVPGMILSIPLTVFLKIILDQFPNTKFFTKLIASE